MEENTIADFPAKRGNDSQVPGAGFPDDRKAPGSHRITAGKTGRVLLCGHVPYAQVLVCDAGGRKNG